MSKPEIIDIDVSKFDKTAMKMVVPIMNRTRPLVWDTILLTKEFEYLKLQDGRVAAIPRWELVKYYRIDSRPKSPSGRVCKCKQCKKYFGNDWTKEVIYWKKKTK